MDIDLTGTKAKLFDVAQLYQTNLNNKELLIFYVRSSEEVGHINVVFGPSNFAHLTGVEWELMNYISAKEFYFDCLRRDLSSLTVEDIGGYTAAKLRSLPELLRLDSLGSLIGRYEGVGTTLFNLKTDKLLSSDSLVSCLGLKRMQHSVKFVPNSALEANAKLITRHQLKPVLAIFKKSIGAPKFIECTRIAKNFSLFDQRITEVASEVIDFEAVKKNSKIEFSAESFSQSWK